MKKPARGTKEYWKLQRETYYQRYRVREMTRTAIKAGKIARGKCEVCQTDKNIEAHHADYSKPMQIQWLCRLHHKLLHIRERGFKKKGLKHITEEV